MVQNEQLMKGLQAIVTNLAQQADGHAIQSRIFASQGFSKLADKYAEHAEEERGYVQKITDRILDLGGKVKNEAKPEMPVCDDAIEWVKIDLQISIDGLNALKPLVDMAIGDYVTYDILKEYYVDEEEDMFWGQQQLELIEKIGVQNWMRLQL